MGREEVGRVGRGREVITFRKWISHIDCVREERILLENPREHFTSRSEGPSCSSS
jgi:hypothetical protein